MIESRPCARESLLADDEHLYYISGFRDELDARFGGCEIPMYSRCMIKDSFPIKEANPLLSFIGQVPLKGKTHVSPPSRSQSGDSSSAAM